MKVPDSDEYGAAIEKQYVSAVRKESVALLSFLYVYYAYSY